MLAGRKSLSLTFCAAILPVERTSILYWIRSLPRAVVDVANEVDCVTFLTCLLTLKEAFCDPERVIITVAVSETDEALEAPTVAVLTQLLDTTGKDDSEAAVAVRRNTLVVPCVRLPTLKLALELWF